MSQVVGRGDAPLVERDAAPVVERGSAERDRVETETAPRRRFDSLRSLNGRGAPGARVWGRFDSLRSLNDRGALRSLHDRGAPGALNPRRSARRGRGRVRAAASVVASLALVAGLAACSSANDDLAQQYRDGDGKGYIAADFTVHEYKPGDQPPAISFEGTLADGTDVSNKTYAGKVTVVNFWWAACAPCRQEAPVLEKVNKQFAGQDVAFLGVNTYDQAATAQSFAKDFDITYPSVIDVDTKSVTTAFASIVPLSATPSTVILDADGRPTARIVGPIKSASIFAALIKTALGESS